MVHTRSLNGCGVSGIAELIALQWVMVFPLPLERFELGTGLDSD